MSTFIFVHGTGVREKSYSESLAVIKKRLEPSGHRVLDCFWGESFGARLHKDGISIPDFDSTRGLGAMTVEDRDLSVWAALYEDPVCELRFQALNPQRSRGFVPNQRTADHQFETVLRQLRVEGALADQIQLCGLSGVWAEATRIITISPELRDALHGLESLTIEFRKITARAIIAQALSLRAAQYNDAADWIVGGERDLLVDLLVDALGGVDRGPIGDAFKKLIAHAVTRFVRFRRGRLSEMSYAAAGDILLYQARGQPIRDFIRGKVEAVEGEAVLLAHSLGGIACVDLLVEYALPQVKALITVGSQASLLYEMGALVSLPFGESLTPDFPERWINIYDPRDFLSYMARGVFHGPKITDVRVNNGQPFPQSHSSYWRNEEVWKAILKELQ